MLPPPPIARPLSAAEALQAYLDVVWLALQRAPDHPDLSPARRRIARGPRRLPVQVYDSLGATTLLSLEITPTGFQVSPADPALPGPRWTISRRHIEAVLSAPEPFSAEPGRFDLNWAR